MGRWRGSILAVLTGNRWGRRIWIVDVVEQLGAVVPHVVHRPADLLQAHCARRSRSEQRRMVALDLAQTKRPASRRRPSDAHIAGAADIRGTGNRKIELP